MDTWSGGLNQENVSRVYFRPLSDDTTCINQFLTRRDKPITDAQQDDLHVFLLWDPHMLHECIAISNSLDVELHDDVHDGLCKNTVCDNPIIYVLPKSKWQSFTN